MKDELKPQNEKKMPPENRTSERPSPESIMNEMAPGRGSVRNSEKWKEGAMISEPCFYLW